MHKRRRMSDWFFEGYRLPDPGRGEQGRQLKYEGKYYTFGLDDAELARMKKRYLLGSAVFTLALLVSYFCPGSGSRSWPGILALFCLCPLFFLWWGLPSLMKQGQRMTVRQAHFSFHYVRWGILFLAVFCGAALLAELVMALFRFSFVPELPMLCALAIATAAAVWLVRLTRRYPLRQV